MDVSVYHFIHIKIYFVVNFYIFNVFMIRMNVNVNKRNIFYLPREIAPRKQVYRRSDSESSKR